MAVGKEERVGVHRQLTSVNMWNWLIVGVRRVYMA